MKTLKDYIKKAKKSSKEQRLQLAQFIDDFSHIQDLRMISEEISADDPISTLFIATAHQLSLNLHLKTPIWLLNFKTLKEPFFVSKFEEFKMIALRDSPYAFRIRNIFVTRNFLSRA